MNAISTQTPILVEKEIITGLNFPKEEILSDEIKIEERNKRVVRAMKLGNNRKIKVKILFEDITGLKKVETTIWGVTEKNIILKKGTLIPINRIQEIKFF